MHSKIYSKTHTCTRTHTHTQTEKRLPASTAVQPCSCSTSVAERISPQIVAVGAFTLALLGFAPAQSPFWSSTTAHGSGCRLEPPKTHPTTWIQLSPYTSGLDSAGSCSSTSGPTPYLTSCAAFDVAGKPFRLLCGRYAVSRLLSPGGVSCIQSSVSSATSWFRQSGLGTSRREPE